MTTPPTGAPYGSAQVLVRLHGQPLGTTVLDLASGPVPPDVLAAVLSARFGEAAAAHLRADGLPADLPPAPPPCQAPLSAARAAGPLVSVVVATRDRPDQLVSCVRSLLASDYPRFEVVVVDNAPRQPATRAALTEAFDGESRLRLLVEPATGVARARNTGMAFARGPLVAFTDDDVEVDPGWLTALVAAFDAEPAAAFVTGLIVAAELDTEAQLRFERFAGFDKGYRRRVFDLDGNRDDSPLYPYAVGLFGSGANMAMRKGVLGDLWAFDVNLGAGSRTRGGEDLDAYLEALHQGRRIVYEPRALVRHHHRRDHASLRRQMYAYGLGLSAVLTKRLLTGRGTRADLLRRVPHGLRHALAPRSRQRPGAGTGYPRDLVVQEWLGIARGPFAYVGSRLANAWATA